MLIFGKISPGNGPGEPRWAPVKFWKWLKKFKGIFMKRPGVFFHQFLVSEPDIYGKMC